MQKYTDLMNAFMPVHKIKFNKKRHKISPWISKGIIKSINVKNKLYPKYLKTKDVQAKDDNFFKYKVYRNRLNKIIKLAKKMYFFKIFEDSKFNTKNAWKNINNLLNKRKTCNNVPNFF